MQQSSEQKMTVKVEGMHCASCEHLIARQWKDLPGVRKVRVDRARQAATIWYDQQPSLVQLQSALVDYEYKIHEEGNVSAHTSLTVRDWKEIFGAAVVLLGLYLLLKGFNILPDSFGVSENTTVGVALGLGLVAAVSTCMAITGGLVLAASSRYNQAHPTLTGRQKFRPHLYFNAGRVFGYIGFGALVGALGSVVSLSPAVTGLMTVVISLLMMIAGLNMLNIWPALSRLQPRPPAWLSNRIHSSSGSHGVAVFGAGAMTFFLPCGFTQALQLYVLSQGSATQGALLLGAFALGTVPGLLSVGALTSFSRGSWQRYAMKAAAVLVIALGFFNFKAGWVAAGWPTPNFSSGQAAVTASSAVTQDGVQIVDMAVVGYEYTPSRFMVKAGVPVEWRIDGSRAAGCARVIVARGIGVQQLLASNKPTTIRFTPTRAGIIPFSCSMGMTTPGAQFLVI